MRIIAGLTPATSSPEDPDVAARRPASPAPAPRPAPSPASAQVRAAQQDLMAGRVRAAVQGFTEVARAADGAVLPAVHVAALAGLTEAHLARGDLAGAGSTAQRAGAVARAHSRSPSGSACATWAAWAAGEHEAARGEHESAVAHLTMVGGLLTRTGPPRDPALLAWRSSAAVALLRTGETTRAAALAREHLDLAEAAGSPIATAQALRVRALLDVGGHREELLRRARAALAGGLARRLAAQLDTDLAGLLLLDGPSGEATRLLHEVGRYAASEDLWPLRSRARRLLDRHGRDEETRVWEEVERLTSAERRVVDLAVQRLTNREVAEHLGVSVKAVEWHLSRVYRKLGVGSRLDLTRLLGPG